MARPRRLHTVGAGIGGTLVFLLGVTGGLAQNSKSAGRGTITGQISNADGTPAIAVEVVILTGRPPQTGRLFAGNNSGVAFTAPSLISAITQTDHLGRYRLENVAPDRYFVAAGTVVQPSWPPAASGTAGVAGLAPFMSEPTYYPTPQDPPLVVSAGTTLKAEFRLQAVAGPSFKLTGQIVGVIPPPQVPKSQAGTPPQQIQQRVKLVPAGESCGRSGKEYSNPAIRKVGGVTPSGAFEIRNVPQGSYGFCIEGLGEAARITVDRDAANLSIPVPQFARGRAGGRAPASAIPVLNSGAAAAATIALAPSGRPILLERRLGMIPRSSLTTMKDCGHVPKDSAQTTIACVEGALRTKTPFAASFERKGVDSQIVIGLGGTAPDIVQVLFDSNSGGDPRVSSPRDCANPKLMAASDSVQVECQ